MDSLVSDPSRISPLPSDDLPATVIELSQVRFSWGAGRPVLDIETLARYSFQQGLSVRQVPLDEMFAKPTYELTKI